MPPTRIDAYGALTRREKEVLCRVAEGDADKEIADALGLKVSTVRTYLERACLRLGARNRAHAVKLFRDA